MQITSVNGPSNLANIYIFSQIVGLMVPVVARTWRDRLVFTFWILYCREVLPVRAFGLKDLLRILPLPVELVNGCIRTE
jgi:hypothetical protein